MLVHAKCQQEGIAEINTPIRIWEPDEFANWNKNEYQFGNWHSRQVSEW